MFPRQIEMYGPPSIAPSPAGWLDFAVLPESTGFSKGQVSLPQKALPRKWHIALTYLRGLVESLTPLL